MTEAKPVVSDEDKAREYALQRCAEIQKRRDMGLPSYPIYDEIVKDFSAGIAHGRAAPDPQPIADAIVGFYCEVFEADPNYSQVDNFVAQFLKERAKSNG